MNTSHIAGAAGGGLVGVVLDALGKRIGLDLSTVDAGALALTLAGVGGGLAHAVYNVGLLPLLSRVLHGPPRA